MAQTRKQKILGDVKKARRQRLIITVVIIVVLAVSIAAVIVLLPRAPQNPLIGAPISTAMQDYLTGVSNSTLVKVGSGTGVTTMAQISGYPPLNFSGKPEFLYVGGEFCPFCASERWSMIVALSRFGTFSGLEYMMSADSPEVYPDTPTFTFVKAQYNSPYISFVSVEELDRNHNALQSLNSTESNIVNTIDCYQGQCGSFAFIDLANKWVMGTPSRAGSQLQALGPQTCQYFCNVGNWTQIGSQLDNPGSSVAQAVDGAANYLITAICNVDGGQPRSVCSQPFAGLTQTPISTTTNAPPANSFNMIITSDSRSDDLAWRNFPKRIF